MNTKLKNWDKAPNFCLHSVSWDCDIKKVCLENLLKNSQNWIILYFYPKDNTPWCTTEAIDFSNNIEKIKKLGFDVIGISKDSIESHCKFIKKHWLKIKLLSDETTETIKKYWAWWEKKRFWKVTYWTIRSTFIIGKDWTILKAYYNVKAKGHVEKILKDLEKILK